MSKIRGEARENEAKYREERTTEACEEGKKKNICETPHEERHVLNR